MPFGCASIRSIARWVFPVLVGPRTATTLRPAVALPLSVKLIRLETLSAVDPVLPRRRVTGARNGPPNVVFGCNRNESGTNPVRIADSDRVLVCSYKWRGFRRETIRHIAIDQR